MGDAFGPGSRAAHEAAGASSPSRASIPIADGLPRPIFGTDISLPTSVLVQRVRDQLTAARGQLGDIAHFLGWRDNLKDVEGLLTCGLIALAYVREQMESMEARPVDRTRCEVCDWPLAARFSEGCVAGNCSYRAERGSPEWWRIQTRRAVLAARAVRAQGIEAEGRDAERLGAKPESPVAEGDAPNSPSAGEDTPHG